MVAEAVCDGMRQHNACVDHVSNAAVAKAALVEHLYDAIVLDVGLPGESGLSVLKFLRDRYDDTPVIMLTARGQLSDRIKGLDAGADDYVLKPFLLGELLARIRAVTRRSKGRVVPVLTRGPLSLHPLTRQVRLMGESVVVSAQEYKVLLCLMEKAGHVVTRSALESTLYGLGEYTESNTIAYFVHQIRRKLGAAAIKTVHGQGYMIGYSE